MPSRAGSGRAGHGLQALQRDGWLLDDTPRLGWPGSLTRTDTALVRDSDGAKTVVQVESDRSERRTRAAVNRPASRPAAARAFALPLLHARRSLRHASDATPFPPEPAFRFRRGPGVTIPAARWRQLHHVWSSCPPRAALYGCHLKRRGGVDRAASPTSPVSGVEQAPSSSPCPA